MEHPPFKSFNKRNINYSKLWGKEILSMYDTSEFGDTNPH